MNDFDIIKTVDEDGAEHVKVVEKKTPAAPKPRSRNS